MNALSIITWQDISNSIDLYVEFDWEDIYGHMLSLALRLYQVKLGHINYYGEYQLQLQLVHRCGAKGFGKPDPFRVKPKAHAEKEEMFKDE